MEIVKSAFKSFHTYGTYVRPFIWLSARAQENSKGMDGSLHYIRDIRDDIPMEPTPIFELFNRNNDELDQKPNKF